MRDISAALIVLAAGPKAQVTNSALTFNMRQVITVQGTTECHPT